MTDTRFLQKDAIQLFQFSTLIIQTIFKLFSVTQNYILVH